jgi:hypothetical protein
MNIACGICARICVCRDSIQMFCHYLSSKPSDIPSHAGQPVPRSQPSQPAQLASQAQPPSPASLPSQKATCHLLCHLVLGGGAVAAASFCLEENRKNMRVRHDSLLLRMRAFSNAKAMIRNHVSLHAALCKCTTKLQFRATGVERAQVAPLLFICFYIA